ncbi:hypothetical protein F7Q99_03090 [Streptomyces kaniharaensis]|uniref:Metal dependent phosphohydrolase n=1 Tax=Streptomyces kaniharaensis TaxID=212423 RepID=A0A5S9CYD7_9ACTN|nr:hypothetical protein [Streptomyces kaniharaensis]AVW82954.1 metal dependent phosphohydrolase [Streptomyces kaniharaensis]MQS11299.1 hypothetical protein [Streptomyces kaniharaensis]QTK22483.1 hypothetical protein [Streptomyces kaniharaensis]
MTSIFDRLYDHTLADLGALDAPYDTGHLSRTAALAGRIAEESGLAAGTARCAAHLYHRFRLPGARDAPAGTRDSALDFLTRSGVPGELHRDLLTVVGPGSPAAETPYRAAVLDAERIDAMGAAGLQRALTGEGLPWHPDGPAAGRPRPAPPELYEELVRAERELLTEPARRLAADRMDLVHRLAADYRTEAELGRLPGEPDPGPAAATRVDWDPKSGFLQAVFDAPATGPLVRIGYRGEVWLTFDETDRLLGIDLHNAPPALVALLPPAQQHRYFWHSTARGDGVAWWADHATGHAWITAAPGLAHHRATAVTDIEVGTRTDRPAVLRLHVQANP